MYKILKSSIVIIAVMIMAAGAKAQFNLVSVEQLNWDTIGSEQTGVNILYTEQGRIVVAWGSLCFVCPYFDIYAVISTNGGQTFSDEIKVNDLDGFVKVEGEEVVAIAENAFHELVFSWTDRRHGTTNSDIYARIRRNNGVFSDPMRVNDDQTFFHQNMPQMIQVGGSDTLIVVWQDGRLCSMGCLSVFASMSVDGGDTWRPNIRASVLPFGTETSQDCRPEAALGNDGQVMVAFRNNDDFYREIYAARSNGDFTFFYPPVEVDTSDWWLPASPRTGPALIQHSSGDWVCAYANGRTGTYKIYTSRSSDNGVSFGDETLVGGDQWQDHPRLIEINNGWLLVAFEENLPGRDSTRIVGSVSYDVGLSWTPLFQISDDAVSKKSNVQIAYDDINTLYAVWVDNREGDKNIYFAILEGQATSLFDRPELPQSASILSAYPNPFNASCKITVADPEINSVSIYDITGRLVKILELSGGEVVWDASRCTSGIYFARAETGKINRSIKLLLLR